MPFGGRTGQQVKEQAAQAKADRAAGRAAWIAANPQKHAAEQQALNENRKRIKDAIKAAKEKKDK